MYRSGTISTGGVLSGSYRSGGIVSGSMMSGAVSSRGTVSSMPYSYSAAPASYGATTYAGTASYGGRPVTYSTPQATTRPITTSAAPVTKSYGAYNSSTIISGSRTVGAQPIGGLTTVGAGFAPTYVGGTISYGGTRPASYIGGTGVTTASANLLAAGQIVSERVIPAEDAYNRGLISTEAPMVYSEVQPITELVVGPSGQVEMVQAAEIVQTVVEPQMVETMMQGDMVQDQQPLPPRVLIVCTSAGALGDIPTGAWCEEITGPFYVFQESGCEVYICSIAGGLVPIDPNSVADGTRTELDQKFLEEGGQQLLEGAAPLSSFPIEEIDCVFLAGGHGTCMDFEASLAQYVTDAVAYGRPVGAVCHGVIGLLSAINQDGTPLLAGRDVTGFSNAEEDQVGLSGVVPFLVQNRMQELGAKYSCAEPWSEYALSDGQITTGQNPQSSVLAARLCVQAMMPPAPQ